MGCPGPAKGRNVSSAVKGMSSLQAREAEEQDDKSTVRDRISLSGGVIWVVLHKERDSAAYSWLEEGEWYDPGCEGADSAAYSWLGEASGTTRGRGLAACSWLGKRRSGTPGCEGDLRPAPGWKRASGTTRVRGRWTLRPTVGWKRASGTTRVRGRGLCGLLLAEEGEWHHPRCEGADSAACSWLEEGEWHTRPTPGWKRARVARPGCEGADSAAYSWLEEGEWHDPGCEGADSAAYSWLEELEALADEVVILPRCNDLLTPSRLGGSELFGASSRDGIIFHNSTSRVQDTTVGNYRPKAEKFMQFSVAEDWSWFLTTEATPYLYAINDYHEDMGCPGPAKGRNVSSAVKGMSSLQAREAEEQDDKSTVR
ncbi:hypothetical protein CYMTET_25243 [Cymbomonas tetramitiformis]|uniref:Uncharacterized protein n=1 Tax=Cymbomonas tetramitiformis TaxID=36881 RepID=A0AAE0FUX5_9CHLO|nr:hypothetical protein CYMTET_25243 [Cymbomonas tetramitiformis]